jgi:protein SCO1/2
MKRIIFATITFGLTVALSFAQGQIMDGPGSGDVVASGAVQQANRNFQRDVLTKMGVDQLLGNQVPADIPFNDEHGRAINFGDLYGKRPIVIMPMFFQCKGVCGVETDSLFKAAIAMEDLNIGRDYDIVMLSINPKEAPDLTLPRWNTAVKDYNAHGNRPEVAQGLHFLTGTLPNIRRLTDALGFKWVYDPKEDTINHPAGMMILSAKGQITGYYVDKDFQKSFLTHLLSDATNFKVSPRTETQLFGCIMIDHVTGRRSLVIENVIRLCAAVFAIGVACWIVGMSLSGKSRKAKGGLA